MFLREALNKMKDVYEKNPQMGDPGSLQPKLAETMNNIDRLRMEIHKNEVLMLTQQSEIKAYFYFISFFIKYFISFIGIVFC